MSIGKFMSTMAGTSVILLLILLLYFFRWDGHADQDKAHVLNSIKGWEQMWQRSSPGFEITYDDFSLRGFPFSTKINLLRPQVAVNLPEGKLHLSTAFLSFSPEPIEGGFSYKLNFLSDIIVMFYPANGSDPQSYMLHLSQIPEVSLRGIAVAGKQADIVNGWSVTMPEKLIVNVIHGENDAGQVTLNVGAMQSTQWMGIPQRIDPAIATLFQFIREVSSQGRVVGQNS